MADFRRVRQEVKVEPTENEEVAPKKKEKKLTTEFNMQTGQNEHGNYPSWMKKSKIRYLRRMKKKNLKTKK